MLFCVEQVFKSLFTLQVLIALAGCVSISRSLSTDLSAHQADLTGLDFVDAKLVITSAKMGQGEDGKVNLENLTKSIFVSVSTSGGFREVSQGLCTEGYAIVPTVVKLTDVFDNNIHLRARVINCRTRAVLYDYQFFGSAFTQRHSMRVIAKLLTEKISEIRAVIHEDLESAIR